MKLYITTINALARIADKQRGATMPEYGLMVALIAVVAAVGAGLLGGAVDLLFENTATAIN